MRFVTFGIGALCCKKRCVGAYVHTILDFKLWRHHGAPSGEKLQKWPVSTSVAYGHFAENPICHEGCTWFHDSMQNHHDIGICLTRFQRDSEQRVRDSRKVIYPSIRRMPKLSDTIFDWTKWRLISSSPKWRTPKMLKSKDPKKLKKEWLTNNSLKFIDLHRSR